MCFYNIYFYSLQQQLTLKPVLFHSYYSFFIIPGFEKKKFASIHVWLSPSECFIQTNLRTETDFIFLCGYFGRKALFL